MLRGPSRSLRRQTAAGVKNLLRTESSPTCSRSTPTGTAWRRLLSPGRLNGPKNLMKVSPLTSTLSPPPGHGRSRPHPPRCSPITHRRSVCLTPHLSRTAAPATPPGRNHVMRVMMDIKNVGSVMVLEHLALKHNVSNARVRVEKGVTNVTVEERWHVTHVMENDSSWPTSN